MILYQLGLIADDDEFLGFSLNRDDAGLVKNDLVILEYNVLAVPRSMANSCLKKDTCVLLKINT